MEKRSRELRNNRICRLYAQGLTQREIARRDDIDVGIAMVGVVLRANGFAVMPNTTKVKVENMGYIARAYKGGMSIQACKEKWNLGDTTLRKILKYHSVKIRPQGRTKI